MHPLLTQYLAEASTAPPLSFHPHTRSGPVQNLHIHTSMFMKSLWPSLNTHTHTHSALSPTPALIYQEHKGNFLYDTDVTSSHMWQWCSSHKWSSQARTLAIFPEQIYFLFLFILSSMWRNSNCMFMCNNAKSPVSHSHLAVANNCHSCQTVNTPEYELM